MTSMIIGSLQSGPPDPGSQLQKTGTPTKSEVENSPFRKSLEKALDGGEKAEKPAEGGKKVPPGESSAVEKSTALKTPGQVGKSAAVKEDLIKSPEKKQSGEKKRITDALVIPAIAQQGEPASPQKPAAVKGKSGEETKKISAEKLSRDKAPIVQGDKSGILQKPTRAAVDSGEASDDKESDGKAAKAVKKENSDGNVIIPFPVTAEKIQKQDDPSTLQMVESNGKTAVKAPVQAKKQTKEDPVLTVVDSRSKNSQQAKPDSTVQKASASVETADTGVKDNNPIVLGNQASERAADETRTFESRFNESREAVLSRELRESGNDQIVRKASFILKDNNQGEIKLILKPEALGQVKIHLNMDENHLVGKIIVENSRVGQIFENNLANLTRAFEEAGITSSSLQVTVGDGNRNGDNRGNLEDRDNPFYSERLKTLDKAVPTLERLAAGQGSGHINLIV